MRLGKGVLVQNPIIGYAITIPAKWKRGLRESKKYVIYLHLGPSGKGPRVQVPRIVDGKSCVECTSHVRGLITKHCGGGRRQVCLGGSEMHNGGQQDWGRRALIASSGGIQTQRSGPGGTQIGQDGPDMGHCGEACCCRIVAGAPPWLMPRLFLLLRPQLHPL